VAVNAGERYSAIFPTGASKVANFAPIWGKCCPSRVGRRGLDELQIGEVLLNILRPDKLVSDEPGRPGGLDVLGEVIDEEDLLRRD